LIALNDESSAPQWGQKIANVGALPSHRVHVMELSSLKSVCSFRLAAFLGKEQGSCTAATPASLAEGKE
jgi:hypothetical protein